MSNDLYARDRQPYNFPDGIKVKGIDLSSVNGAKAVVLFTTQTNSAPAVAVAVPLKQVLLVVMAVYAYLFL